MKAGRARSGEEELTLELLKVVEENSQLTQRSVATQLGIALGLANAYVKRCVSKGLIKIRQAPAKRYQYYLTPKGFAEKSRLTASFLRASFEVVQRAKEECDNALRELQSKGADQIVLLGRSELSEVMLLLSRNFNFSQITVVDGDETAAEIIKRVEEVDGYIVTSLSRPMEFYVAAVSVHDKRYVVVPKVLRLTHVD